MYESEIWSLIFSSSLHYAQMKNDFEVLLLFLKCLLISNICIHPYTYLFHYYTFFLSFQLKAFYVDLLVPLETNLEKDTKVVQFEQKKFLQNHKIRTESYSKAAATMKKQRKKKNSPQSTDKDIKVNWDSYYLSVLMMNIKMFSINYGPRGKYW